MMFCSCQILTSQFNSNRLCGLILFAKIQSKYTPTQKKSRTHVQRIWKHLQVSGTTKWWSHKSIFHNLSPRISEGKKSVPTELIYTSISSLWNWRIYQWSGRMRNKEHKSNPFALSFSSVLAEFLLLTNFLFRPIGVLFKTALKAKVGTIALLLDIKASKKFLNLLIKLSRICPHITTYGSRYLCVQCGKLKSSWQLSATQYIYH